MICLHFLAEDTLMIFFENLMVQGIVKVFILVYNKNVDKIMIKF